jgi:hypothetical protein
MSKSSTLIMVQRARFALIKGQKIVRKEQEIAFHAFCPAPTAFAGAGLHPI